MKTPSFFSSFSITKQCTVLFLLTFVISTIPAAPGKDFWEKKEYREWSKKDCRKMLENSPWVEKYEKTSIDVNMADATSSDGGPPFIRYQLQLRSALPVREAIVRQTQIANNYDDLSAEQQQAIDKQTDPFLNANFEDVVVVYVSYETNHRNVATELSRYWQTQNTDRLKFSVYLQGEKGEKVALSQYTYVEGADSFQFVFPRKLNGTEVLGPEDKDLNLEFPTPSAGRIRGDTAYIEFKTKKMTYNDKLEY